MTVKPITREEKFLAKAGGQNVETPEPITRKEMFLDAVAKNDGGGGSSEFIVNIARGLDFDTMEEVISLDKTYDEIMANLDSAVLIEEKGGGRKFIYRFASKELYPDTQELYLVFHGYTSNLWDKSEKCTIWHRFIRVNADNTVNLISVLIKDFATS